MGTIRAPGYGRPLADDTSLSCVSGFAAMPNGEVRSICWYCKVWVMEYFLMMASISSLVKSLSAGAFSPFTCTTTCKECMSWLCISQEDDKKSYSSTSLSASVYDGNLYTDRIYLPHP